MSIFFDASTLISTAMTCSLPMLRKLKQVYGGDFYITDAVYQETVGRAMHSLRFRYEGHRLKELIDDGVIKLYSDKPLMGQINELLDLLNRTYSARNRPLNIVQLGEISATVACLKEKSEAIALDERTARLLIENPEALKPWLEHKLHTRVFVNKEHLKQWSSYIAEKPTPLRSADLAVAAWKKGILGDDKDVIFGLLWALKFAGCAITEDEINSYMKKISQ